MKVDREWERRRAVIGFLEIARDALQNADAMLEGDEPRVAILKDRIYGMRIASREALDAVPPLSAFVAAPSESPAEVQRNEEKSK